MEKVRHIRNELERRGHNPLRFFLKCLENDDARLPGLIREEIQAREWFILCDSPNVKKSTYVPQEVELAKAKAGKGYKEIDLSADLESQFYKLGRFSKRATVFLSYPREDNTGSWITAFIAEHRQFSGGHKLTGFFDRRDIRGFDDWRHRIHHGLAMRVSSRVHLCQRVSRTALVG